jgi:coenzyme F420-0:L-glutamate ligase/coenzyme F420-1:gamma-L-glutamate ligase
VIISDTFGRPWRDGLVNVAIGLAGIAAIKDYTGLRDAQGYELKVTALAIADELAAAAELVMNKLDNMPVAIVRYDYPRGGSLADCCEPQSAICSAKYYVPQMAGQLACHSTV